VKPIREEVTSIKRTGGEKKKQKKFCSKSAPIKRKKKNGMI